MIRDLTPSTFTDPNGVWIDDAKALVNEGIPDDRYAYNTGQGGNGWAFFSGYAPGLESYEALEGFEFSARLEHGLRNTGARDGLVADPVPHVRRISLEFALTKDGVTPSSLTQFVDLEIDPINLSVLGGDSVLWGESWTPEEVNSPTFGVLVRVPTHEPDEIAADYARDIDYTQLRIFTSFELENQFDIDNSTGGCSGNVALAW
jgi:hypothetical protein